MERILIKKVQENDILYNPKSTYYRDTDLRHRTWQKIGKELNLKPEEARSAWDKLRRCFINARNRRRVKENEGITIHPWKYEKDMGFLWPFVERNRKTLDFTKSGDTTIYENPDSDPEETEKDISNEIVDSANNIKTETEHIQEYNSPGQPMVFFGNDDTPTSIVETSMGYKREFTDDDGSETREYKRPCLLQDNPLLKMDESDLFFMSMSKMTKSLPVLDRAKVKLAVSNAVLQAIISAQGNVDSG